jgi:hypothetical protein
MENPKIKISFSHSTGSVRDIYVNKYQAVPFGKNQNII